LIEATSFQAVGFEHRVDRAAGHHRRRVGSMHRLIGLLEKGSRRFRYILMSGFGVGKNTEKISGISSKFGAASDYRSA
jgi:hypothetical protein